MIHDEALIRQLLFSAQQALFEGVNNQEKIKLAASGLTPKSIKSSITNQTKDQPRHGYKEEETPDDQESVRSHLNQNVGVSGFLGGFFKTNK